MVREIKTFLFVCNYKFIYEKKNVLQIVISTIILKKIKKMYTLFNYSLIVLFFSISFLIKYNYM